ncbi:MAG: FAD-dependent oxidoreductase [Parcubacteria group bacterium]|nr:FAD-dependent oxidoreductase [Parcubacteria group bacterium]
MPFKSKLKERKMVAEATEAFWFEKPKTFSFKPGQYIDVTLKELVAPDPRGNNRVFSIASSPGDEDIMIATRLTGSNYGETLMHMPLGTEVELDGPFGSFTLPRDTSQPVVLVAGGIGITPFRSMIKYVTEQKLSYRLTLLYTNRTPALSAFLDDFAKWSDENPLFRFVAIVVDPLPAGQKWGYAPYCRTGLIDASFIQKEVESPKESVFYVAGPPVMVHAITEELFGLGIPHAGVKFEEFSGYQPPHHIQ